jgi:hypothetical protein
VEDVNGVNHTARRGINTSEKIGIAQRPNQHSADHATRYAVAWSPPVSKQELEDLQDGEALTGADGMGSDDTT